MKRVIVDYKKLTPEILNLLVAKFPYGYDREDIIRFQNIKNEMVEALEVRTEDTIYLVKVSQGLANTMSDFEEDDQDDNDDMTTSIEDQDFSGEEDDEQDDEF